MTSRTCEHFTSCLVTKGLNWSHLVTDLRVELAARGGELVLELDEEERRLGGVDAQAASAHRRTLHLVILTYYFQSYFESSLRFSLVVGYKTRVSSLLRPPT